MFNSITQPLLAEAFQMVKANQGCAGADGVSIAQFEKSLSSNLNDLINQIKNKKYSPFPLLRILVDKGNGEARTLCVPAVKDRVLQKAVLMLIEPILEKEFEECSFAYRKGRSVKQAVFRIREHYEAGYRWVVDADIDTFFDSVDHELMLSKIKKYIKDSAIVGFIEMWMKAETWDGKSLRTVTRGIPQGSPISPILANLFLDELDEKMAKSGRKFVRFSDDFIVLCKTPDKARDALELTNTVLESLFLKLDEGEIVSFDQGFQFLGVTFIRSMAFIPFDKPKKEKRVIHFPAPLSVSAYNLKKAKDW